MKKKLDSLEAVCGTLKKVDNAQVEFALFRGCLSYNKINHLLRTCPPDLLQDALVEFDDHFQYMWLQFCGYRASQKISGTKRLSQ